ncbi:MAG: NAD kinase [Bacteroidales bacterium]|nr:NAD kinase [Bacteroidales bacterium]
MIAAVYGRLFGKAFHQSVKDFFDILQREGTDIIIYKPFKQFIESNLNFSPRVKGLFNSHTDLPDNTDMIFSIGGDGTFLDTVSLVREKGIPIVGVNSGRLGFLATISQEKLLGSLDVIFRKKFSIEERTLLKLDFPGAKKEDFNYALNEVSIEKVGSTMITIHAYINGEFLNTYWADGLIISTPTGSTAYSLSVGGPIVIPGSDDIIISPISPHNLTVRPLVIPDKDELTLRVEGRDEKYIASVDSRSVILPNSTEVRVKRAEFKMKILKLKGHSYYGTLRDKLMWGADKRN